MTPKRPRQRPALTVFPALVCLVIASMVGIGVLRTGLLRRDLARAEAHRLQAEWLVESGLQRASARLSSDPKYRGETWEIPSKSLGGPLSGGVVIVIEQVKDQPRRLRLRVQADYPSGPEGRVRQSRDQIVNQPTEKPGEPS